MQICVDFLNIFVIFPLSPPPDCLPRKSLLLFQVDKLKNEDKVLWEQRPGPHCFVNALFVTVCGPSYLVTIRLFSSCFIQRQIPSLSKYKQAPDMERETWAVTKKRSQVFTSFKPAWDEEIQILEYANTSNSSTSINPVVDGFFSVEIPCILIFHLRGALGQSTNTFKRTFVATVRWDCDPEIFQYQSNSQNEKTILCMLTQNCGIRPFEALEDNYGWWFLHQGYV